MTNGPAAGEVVRTLPVLDEHNRSFWTGGERGELMIQKCAECGYHVHPPSVVCPVCLKMDPVPTPVSGHGQLYSFTINHQAWVPGLPTPYVVAIVELVEQTGLRLTTNLIGVAEDRIRIGMPVKVAFERCAEVYVPLFVDASQGGER